jgi:Zn finger protein HypA/HybF involved in hydrogenase expression
MTYVPKEAIQQARAFLGDPRERVDLVPKTCAGCGRVLTPTEIEHYEVTCEDCEGKEMQAVREEELRALRTT